MFILWNVKPSGDKLLLTSSNFLNFFFFLFSFIPYTLMYCNSDTGNTYNMRVIFLAIEVFFYFLFYYFFERTLSLYSTPV